MGHLETAVKRHDGWEPSWCKMTEVLLHNKALAEHLQGELTRLDGLQSGTRVLANDNSEALERMKGDCHALLGQDETGES